MERNKVTTIEEVKALLKPSGVTFYDDSEDIPEDLRHTYWLGDKQLKGITSGSLTSRAFPSMYAGISASTLKNAAAKGTAVHKLIEDYEITLASGLPFPPDTDDINLKHWIEIKKKNNIEVIATEYLVSDRQNYASSIDILGLVNGELAIIDIKHTQTPHLDATSLQTSIYQRFLELQSRGIKVSHRYMMWLHEEKYAFYELPLVSIGAIVRLIKADITNDPDYKFDYKFNFRPAWFSRKIEREMVKALKMAEFWSDKVKEYKEQMKGMLEASNYNALPCTTIKASLIAGSTSVSLDFAKLKAEKPELANELLMAYPKVVEKKQSISFRLNK